MRWLFLAPLSFAFTLLAILLAPVLALFVKDDGYLPRCLWWFQTPDNPAIGDAAYRQNEMRWTNSRYLLALFWLCRNPAYGFDHSIGAKIEQGFVYRWRGDEEVNNTPLHSGWLWRMVTNPDGSRYWQFLAVYGWSKTRCIKISLGWKLWTFNRQDAINAALENYIHGKPKGLEAGQVRQLVCTINPFTKRT